jgi:REP element-mobilizing transposase RayT
VKRWSSIFAERERLLSAFMAACDEFRYLPLDLTIEAWHLHWIVRHDDRVMSMVGRLKNRMRQALKRGRIWTEGYCHNVLKNDEALFAARDYIRKHPGCRVIDGRMCVRTSNADGSGESKDTGPPGEAGG